VPSLAIYQAKTMFKTLFFVLAAATVARAQAFVGGDLCGQSFPTGTYTTVAACSMSPCTLSLGNADVTFECGAGLTTAAGSIVTADAAANVNWKVGAATAIGAGSEMIGNLESVGAITLGAGAVWTGDLLSTAGAVSLGASAHVYGDIEAAGAIALGANAVAEDLTSINGAITLGANAHSGTTDAPGAITKGAGATVSGTQGPGSDVSMSDLCGKTLSPDVYTTTGTCGLSCTLTLDDDGVTGDALKWEFHCGGVLTTAADSKVVFKDDTKASPDDVLWVIGAAAAIGAGSEMIGNLESVGAITLGAYAVWTGILKSTTGAVSLGAGSEVVGPGDIEASGAITLGANALAGDLTSTNGAITLGASADSGALSAPNGALTLGAGATQGSSVPSLSAVPSTVPSAVPSSAPSSFAPSQSVCENFAVHARTTITFDGVSTTIHDGRDVGVFPGTSITGSYMLDGGAVVGGATDFAASVLAAHAGAIAVRDNGNAMAIEMGGVTFTPGTYRSGSAINIAYGTVVTLDAEGEGDAVFLFQAGTTLVTAADTYFNLLNGAKAENVLWALGTAATLGANSIVEGSILAGTAITFGTKSVLHGCALAQSAVTFESEGSIELTHYEDGNAGAGHLRG
jgi:hypothetical protein